MDGQAVDTVKSCIILQYVDDTLQTMTVTIYDEYTGREVEALGTTFTPDDRPAKIGYILNKARHKAEELGFTQVGKIVTNAEISDKDYANIK